MLEKNLGERGLRAYASAKTIKSTGLLLILQDNQQ